MRASVVVTVAPAVEPVTVSEAKAYLRVDSTADDTLIGQMITAARELVEQHLRRKLITQTLRLTFDRFPQVERRGHETWWNGVRQGAISDLYSDAQALVLPCPPLQSVTSLVTYDDTGASATFPAGNYTVDTAGGRVCLNNSAQWPYSLRAQRAVEVTYVAGYGANAAAVPQAIIIGVQQVIAALYNGRDCAEMPMVAKTILAPYRVLDGIAYGNL